MPKDREIPVPPAEATASAPVPTTEEQARAALRENYAATLRRLWKQPDDCPICGSNAWNTGDLIQTPLRDVAPTPRTYADLLDPAPAQAYLYMPVTCVICGY